jgi:hypothetical protein
MGGGPINFFPWLASNHNPPISASLVAEITGVGHHTWLTLSFFNLIDYLGALSTIDNKASTFLVMQKRKEQPVAPTGLVGVCQLLFSEVQEYLCLWPLGETLNQKIFMCTSPGECARPILAYSL